MNFEEPSLTDQMRATLEWWQLAGVDSDFVDDATDWLGADQAHSDVTKTNQSGKTSPTGAKTQGSGPEHADAQDQAKSIECRDLIGANPPQTLAEFHEWWLSAPGLDAIGPRGRVAPRGPENAELMVLVIDPEEKDQDTLLSGPQGRLMSRIIDAMGLAQGSVYFASALPRHTPMADTSAIAASGMKDVTQFHVNLVNPQKVLAFGAGIPPLLGHGLTNDLSLLLEINQKSSSIPLFVTEGLDAMMAMPRLKARFWRRWIEWSAKG